MTYWTRTRTRTRKKSFHRFSVFWRQLLSLDFFNSLIAQLDSRAQRVTHALAAGADQWVGGRQHTGLGLGILLDLGDGVDNAGHETNDDGRDTGEGDRSVEENQTRNGNGELVQGTNHGVGGRGGGTNTPGGGVGDEDGGDTGDDHSEEDAIAVGLGEVTGQVGSGPVLDEQSGDDEDGDGEEIVIEHS